VVVGLDIDEKRGDLWVASTADTSGTSTVHRLQLVSGRPLKTYRTATSVGATRLVGLAVQASGDVIALDGAGSRLLALTRGGSELTLALSLKLSGARSVAAGDDNVLYVAHDDGIARIDLRSGSVAPLSAPKGFDLQRFDTIRVHRNALIGLQTSDDGSRQLVRLNLNPAGRAVKDGTVIDPRVAGADGRTSLSITGNDLYYLSMNPRVDAVTGHPASSSNPLTFVVRRLTLR
jgi:hypothetical protein